MSNALSTPTSDNTALARPRAPTIAPLVDIHQNADELLLLADLPGVSREGLSISYERGQIRIHGQPSELPTQGRVLYGQRLRPAYARTFSIPGTIDVTRISAELDNGVLKVHLPKMDQAKPRQIQIRGTA